LINEQLISACKENDRRAQRKLYEFCYDILARVGYRYAKNAEDVQEIINESFMKIVRNADRLLTLTMSVEAYIWRAGVNTAIDLYRKNNRYKKTIQMEADLPDDWKAAEGESPAEALAELDVQEIMACLRELPNMTREIVNLFSIDGYTHKEIAKMLNIKESLSRWHLHKGRKLLYEQLKHNYSLNHLRGYEK